MTVGQVFHQALHFCPTNYPSTNSQYSCHQGLGTTGPNEAALPRNTVSSHTYDWWSDQLQWNTDSMSLIEPPKMVKIVQSLGECKIKETLILGALSWDHTKRA